MVQIMYSIKFDSDGNGSLIDAIRTAAKADRWTTMVGFKQWAKEKYNATLRTSIYFKNEQDMNRFKIDFGVE